ncbi:MAG: AAA family ATPase [Bacteroidales bacterium]|nr:AAA family ATPase [Bacteroidales bacterium]
MKEVLRSDYIDWLDRKRGNGLVKIITGVRRCGKSYLLFTLFKRHLLEQGVKNDHIIALALDDYENRQFLDADALYKGSSIN